uniref:Uncharacterized protein n=1 Tax=Hippocampus comes TaxID=109280 RepID=A0A3Q2XCJ0_HIPCM
MLQLSFLSFEQLGVHSDFPGVLVEQIPHPHLLAYSGFLCEETHEYDQQLPKGECTAYGLRLFPLSTC